MATKKRTSSKDASLEATLAEIKEMFGTETIMRMGDTDIARVEANPSDILPLDLALGIGGLPKGRIVEIYGPESSGKSTVALHAVAAAQAAGLVAAYVDIEYALDPEYMRAVGVDVDNLLLSQPETAEQVLSIVNMLCESGKVGIIIVDSVSVMEPRASLEGEIGENHIGLIARLLSQGLRRIVGSASKSGTTVFFINQIRDKIGVVYGSPETTSGGRALKFYSSVRMDIRRGEQIKDGDDVIGNRTKIKVVKNKVAPAYKVAEFDIIYGKGAPKENCLVDVATEMGIIKKSGAWYNYEGEQIGQGRPKAIAFLVDNPIMYDEILSRVKEAVDVQVPE